MTTEEIHYQIGPPVKEIIATVLAIPFVLVSTWFGISAVNYHFDAEKRDAAVRVQDEREQQRSNEMKCFLKGKTMPDGTCILTNP
jgi:hypothetical protein